jgi:uncharacterized protein YmfQ (DUF2313 family)
MGIKVAGEKDYSNSIRGLFPQGEYWDRQFENPESDASLFCKAKAPEIVRLRKRMGNLLEERNCQTAVETLGDWERVMLGHTNAQLPIEERIKILGASNVQIINRMAIENIAKMHGFILKDIQFPYRPAFFGFSRFGLDPIASPAAWQMIFFHVLAQGNDDQVEAFERHANNLLANYTTYFCYDGGKP